MRLQFCGSRVAGLAVRSQTQIREPNSRQFDVGIFPIHKNVARAQSELKFLFLVGARATRQPLRPEATGVVPFHGAHLSFPKIISAHSDGAV
jgi:hypothetical protein